MPRYLLVVFLCGGLLFLGQEWSQQRTFKSRFLVAPNLVALQSPAGNYYAFGSVKKFTDLKPFGYFFGSDRLIDSQSIETGQSQTNLSRWSANFAVLRVGQERIFWFGQNFTWAEITHLPIKLESDIWLLDKVVPGPTLPPPKDAIVWYDDTKRLPKVIKTLSEEHRIPVLVPAQSGQLWVRFKRGEWEL